MFIYVVGHSNTLIRAYINEDDALKWVDKMESKHKDQYWMECLPVESGNKPMKIQRTKY